MQPSRKSEQYINNYIQNQDNIMVKWIYDPDHKMTKKIYLNYMEKQYGFKLLFNRKTGGRGKRCRTKDLDQTVSMKSKTQEYIPTDRMISNIN